MKQKLLLIAAVFFGLLAFFLTYQQIKTAKQEVFGLARDIDLIEIIRPMSAGDRIKQTDIRLKRVKRFNKRTTKEVEYSKRESIFQRQLDVPLNPGDILEWKDIKSASFQKKKELASIIPRGMRAISISVDAVGSVSGLVKPGNKVDLIGTFRFPENRGDQSYDTLTLTILQNVKLLATGTNYGNSAGNQRGFSTVTLALTPKEAEMIIFASQKGRIQMSLRNDQETAITQELQSINFKYLEEHIQDYIDGRKKK